MIDLRLLLVVGAGAGIGGILRLLVTQIVVGRWGLDYGPAATLFINVSGSFLIGVVIGLIQLRADVHPFWRAFFATGILGGYTTFSTFSFEALSLAQTSTMWTAAGYVAVSVALGIGGAMLGISAVRFF